MAAAAASGQIYENYDQVVVPDGTAPGAAFTVQMWQKAGQRRRAVAVQLWAGSGAAPAVQPRQAVIQSGKRHELRPNALARRGHGTGRYDAAESHVTREAAVAAWAAEEQLPFEALRTTAA